MQLQRDVTALNALFAPLSGSLLSGAWGHIAGQPKVALLGVSMALFEGEWSRVSRCADSFSYPTTPP